MAEKRVYNVGTEEIYITDLMIPYIISLPANTRLSLPVKDLGNSEMYTVKTMTISGLKPLLVARGKEMINNYSRKIANSLIFDMKEARGDFN